MAVHMMVGMCDVRQVADCRLRFRYSLGAGEQRVVLSYVNVSDGTWHTAFVNRIGQWVELKVDGGEGRNFNESFGFSSGHHEIRLSQRNIFAGGDVRFPSSNSVPLVDNDFENGNKHDLIISIEKVFYQCLLALLLVNFCHC